MIIPAIVTLFCPVSSRLSFEFALFVRCIIGLFQSASFPALFHFIPIWIPAEEKTLMLPVIFTGIYIGEIIGFPLSTVMVNSHFTINGNSYGGWPATFYVFGVCGILWYPLWSYLAYETPDAHPHITKEELDYINSGACVYIELPAD